MQNNELSLNKLNDYFNSKCFSQIYTNQEFLMSPLSVTLSMMMTYLGCNGKTKEELGRSLGITNEKDESLYGEMMYLMSKLKKDSPELKLCLSNGIFVGSDFVLSSEYCDLIKKIGAIETVDFNDSKTLNKINSWVSDNTNKLIPNLLSPENITSDTCMVLINTLYFKGKWRNQFNQIKKGKFASLKGSKDVEIMSVEETYFPYYEDSEYQVIEVPYKGDLSFGIILPKKTFANTASPNHFINNMHQKYINLYMPKFTQRNKTSLKSTFKSLGVNQLFINGDFSPMTPLSPEKKIYVDDIIHEVVLIVDEYGTEAAAATAQTFMYESCMVEVNKPIIFRADHTFSYYIRNVPTNTLLFTGVFDG